MRRLLTLLLAACVALSPSLASAQVMENEEEAQPAVTDSPAPARAAPAAPDEAAPEEPGEAEGAVEEGEARDAEGTAVESGGGYEPDQRGTHEEREERELDEERIERGAAPMDTAGDYGEATVGYDATRPFGFELQLWLGAALTGLDAVRGGNLVRSNQQGGVGGSFGFVGALRLGPVSVGPRVGFLVDPSFVLGTVGGDVQVRILEEPFTPFLRASVSYAFLLGLAGELPSQSEAGIDGVLAELGLGVRWRVFGPIVIGAEASAGYLHLSRAAVPDCAAPCTDGDFDLALPGESDGMTVRIHVWTGASF